MACDFFFDDSSRFPVLWSSMKASNITFYWNCSYLIFVTGTTGGARVNFLTAQCKFFLIEHEKLALYCVIHSKCKATQCIILCTVCNLHNPSFLTNIKWKRTFLQKGTFWQSLVYSSKVSGLYNVYNISWICCFCTHPVLYSIYT